MDVIIHKQIDAFEKTYPNWERLREEFYDVTVFQDINWLKSWWSYKSKQSQIIPYIIEIKDGEKTIGIIPLYRSIKLKMRVLRPMCSEISDYLIPILSKKYPPDRILGLGFKEVYKDHQSWDYIEWGDVPEDSDLAHFINNQMRESKMIIRKKSVVCPCLTINGNIEDVKLKFSKSFIKGVLYKERKLKREGKLTYSKAESEEEIEPLMNKFFELHCERWKNTDTPSVFRYEEEREHAIQSAKGLFKSNLLHLSFISSNDEIVVIHFGMSDGKRIYWYLHAINPEYGKYSPGNLLIYYLILEACRVGYELVDFLRGDEEYKYKWGSIDKFNAQYILFNRTIKSKILKGIYQTTTTNGFMINYFKPVAKRLLQKTVVK